MKKILILGGHLTPALALIESLKEQKVEIIFLGRKKVTEGKKPPSAEYQQVGNLNVKFQNIVTGRIQRHLTLYTVPSLFKIPIGFIQTFLTLLYFRPSIVVSFGGSLSFPAVFAAWLLGIGSITHEQSAIPGISNRINSVFVNKIFLTWKESLKYFPAGKSHLIGNLEIKPRLNLKNEKLSGFLKSKKPLLLVAGGNQGSHFINNLIFENIDKLRAYNIVHQIGTADYKNDHYKARHLKKPYYLSFDFIPANDFSYLVKNANYIISRSGANTVWQIASSAKTGILIPLPRSAANEQQHNAQILEDAGSAIILRQKEAAFSKVLTALKQLETNYNSMKESAVKFKKSLPENATEVLTKEILQIIY